jgi:hypothetical protein
MLPPNSAGNPLSAGSLSVFMAASLPKAAGSQVKNAGAAIALAVHAGMIAVGFRLVGLGEEDRIRMSRFPVLGEFVLIDAQRQPQTHKTPSHYRLNGTPTLEHTHSATPTPNPQWSTS